MKDKLKALLITLGLFALVTGVIYTIRQWPNEFFTIAGIGAVVGIFIAVYVDILDALKENKKY